MESEIKVHVVRYPNRPNLVMRYVDPITCKQVTKTAGTPNAREASKAAAVWEAELRAGSYAKPSRMAWDAFRDYYEANVLPGLSDNTSKAYATTLNAFEKHCKPTKLADVTTQRLTYFVRVLREAEKSEATIARHLRHLKAPLRWAHREGLLPVLPTFTMPKRVKGAKVMRGRPITLEEFERMLTAVPVVVENAAAPSWEFYLRGLWDSGLRLTESLSLRWDDEPGAIVADFTGKRPMLRIPAEAQKANRDELLPMTPEFAALLLTVPEAHRRGRVFKLIARDGSQFHATKNLVSKMVSTFGAKAGVVVDERELKDKIVRKFASAHDLRRAFGQRWSGKVMPSVLRRLMRHASIQTTMAYYVGNDAEATADAIWAGSNSGSSQQKTEAERPEEHSNPR
ncbi:MAG: tyrosine-type recombinase/integrase [Pirellulales bacterium]